MSTISVAFFRCNFLAIGFWRGRGPQCLQETAHEYWSIKPQTKSGTHPPTATETTPSYSAGTVTTYKPGKTIVVESNLAAATFALGTAARIVDGAGHIVTSELRPGQRVRVYYTGTGNSRTVERVIVQD